MEEKSKNHARSRPRRRKRAPAEKLQAKFIARYGPTPRETDVLRAVTGKIGRLRKLPMTWEYRFI